MAVHTHTPLLVAITVAVLSLLAAAVNLILIRILNKWNAFVLLVCSLTISQAIYDACFLFLPWNDSSMAMGIYDFFAAFGGLTATLWTNVLILIVFKIVLTIHCDDTMKQV
jgi:hypothetical protein